MDGLSKHLWWMIQSMPSKIKKRSEFKPYYINTTAGANMYLRIYYGRVREYLASLEESKES